MFPPQSPCHLVPFGVFGHRGLWAIFKRHENKSIFCLFTRLSWSQIWKTQQMPKRSIRDDWAKAMIGGVKPKPKPKPKEPSDTARKQTATTGQTVAKCPTGGWAASSDIGLKKASVNIPMKDMSPEFKRLVVEELIRTGRARVVTRRPRKRRRRRRKGRRRRSSFRGFFVKFVFNIMHAL